MMTRLMAAAMTLLSLCEQNSVHIATKIETNSNQMQRREMTAATIR
jgi:hypothetical protein